MKFSLSSERVLINDVRWHGIRVSNEHGFDTCKETKLTMKCLYFLYHELRRESSAYTYAIDSAEFKRHCELVEARQQRTMEIRPEITFDDGHRSNYEVALPILSQHRLQAKFFITAGWVGQRAAYMNRSELFGLREAGHAIGAHGWSHALLTHCNHQQLERELVGARQSLEDWLGCAVKTMSLPGGRFNKRVIQACWEAGYVEVFTSMPRLAVFERAVHTVVGRLNIHGDLKVSRLEQVLNPRDALLSRLGRKEILKEAARRLLGDTLYQKLWGIINHYEQGKQVVEPLER